MKKLKDQKPTAETSFQEAYLTEKRSHANTETLLNAALQEIKILKHDLDEQNAALQTAQDDLKKLTNYDCLTGLPNRQQFSTDLKREVARAKRYQRFLALLYIDIDYLKKINDRFGAEVGDLLLKDISLRLQRLLRAEDILARVGGDEFAVILTEIANAEDASIVAQRILETLNKPYELAGQIILNGASIGISCFPDAGIDAVELHKNANIALHTAKSSFRNSFQFFSAVLQNEYKYRSELEIDLHFALKKKEFYLMYQPRIDIQSGCMVGMEALLRWNHPVRGNVPPTEFIHIAEENGLILSIGEWVLRAACKQFSQWRRAGVVKEEVVMAVNVSVRQFQQTGFTELVSSILDETSITPSSLELEITENSAVSYLEKIQQDLQKLREIGVLLSIDDFGKGYSSFERLKQMPIQAIKIDKSFVNDIDVKLSDNLIVSSTISLGKNMGLNVIAEGVETEEQLRFLIKNRCPQAQGFYYSKPLTTEELCQFVKKTPKE